MIAAGPGLRCRTAIGRTSQSKPRVTTIATMIWASNGPPTAAVTAPPTAPPDIISSTNVPVSVSPPANKPAMMSQTNQTGMRP